MYSVKGLVEWAIGVRKEIIKEDERLAKQRNRIGALRRVGF